MTSTSWARQGRISAPNRPARRRFVPRVESAEARLLLSTATSHVRPHAAQVHARDAGTVPLTDLQGTYQGQDGGLYGGGSNVPPASQAEAAAAAAAKVRPLDRNGRPAPDGKIVLLSIGQSTSSMIFGVFRNEALSLPGRSPAVIPVDGAQDGMVLQSWQRGGRPWATMLGRLRDAGVTPRQVQVLWIDLAQIHAPTYGGFPEHSMVYANMMTQVIQHAERLFPNARLAFLSARIYGGYGPQGADPEPYAYESGFGVRYTIQGQEAGDPALNDVASRGPVRAPVLLWGPYLWANGETPSSSGLTWSRGDFFTDGVHPSASGRAKAAAKLVEFFTTNAAAKPWFTAH